MNNLLNKPSMNKQVEFSYDGPFVPSTYFEKEETRYFEITRGFSTNGLLFYNEVIYKNKFGKPYIIYEKVDDEPGFYRRINSKGQHSNVTFSSFLNCLKGKATNGSWRTS